METTTEDARRAALLSAVGTVLHKDISDVTDATRLYEDLNLDSATALQVLIELEDGLGLDLDPVELAPGDLTTIGSLLAYLARVGQTR